MSQHKSTIPDNIAEEYYQINPDILSSFPKYRPPLDLFEFKDDIAQLVPYIRKGNRLSNEQVDQLNELCAEGSLFVARSDHPVYSKHIVKQLDLVLVDKNLKESEIADIFVQALSLRLEEFFDQPVQLVFDKLYKDVLVLTEYLTTDHYRIRALAKRLIPEHTLVNHSVNSGIIALWLYIKSRQGVTKRRDLDRTALACFLHDLGMCKIPQFLRTKTVPLTQEERQKVNMHPMVGAKLAQKLGLTFDEIQQAILEHHERLDGSGYPRKLKDDAMSKLGKIVAVADSYCAMISERPYASAMPPMEAAESLRGDARYDAKTANTLYNGIQEEEV
ncbi:MAG: HD domain-containing protein [Desulfovibrio sp.]|nr:MAG: HD domain-containing protein [Desulfovibrio sp.]